jgi:AcrR family transcriptional regulator
MTERSDVKVAPTAPRVSDQRRPGRPRDARADAAIMDAAVAVLADRGPAGFTVDEVASRAGCGKATVYRRWPSRAELLLETAQRLGLEPPVVDNGSLRADLVELLSTLAHKMRDTTAGRILPGIIAEASVEPGMRRILAKFIADRRGRPREVMERGIARRELPADADVELILDLLGGTIMYRELIAGEVVDRAYVERLVDKVLGAFGATTVTPPG